ncbi:hypothetical protein DAEQUDRAFT_194831 [Daedalea quercina L-15889]|uniref:Uncharacterized protein n=1 Tax=Daedalea quercina L-15889 TaxID=1314783 RepID=A0A165U6T1_9APHY|nr:hypothetical protein DAEQUDRAFT_194831 [Daedalea quercina L-15889]
MLCNWSTSSANTILHTLARRTSVLRALRHVPCAASLVARVSLHRTYPSNSRASFFTSSFTSGAAALASIPAPKMTTAELDQPAPEDTDTEKDSNFLLSLTAGKISRASAQAVRMSMQKGKFGDALYLINSLLESHNSDAPPSSRTQLINSKSRASPLAPIDFGQPVSPRLSAHAFLHGLVRTGFGKRAAAYVETFQTCGIQIRPATVGFIVHSLTSSPNPIPLNSSRERGAIKTLRRKGPDGEQVLKIRSSMVSDSCTRAAVKLLLHARLTGERRMEQLYGSVIPWLVLQGEIIMGSLLVVLFFKSLEANKSHPEVLPAQADADSTPLCPDGHSPFIPITRADWFKLPRAAVDTMNIVLREINTVMDTPSPPDVAEDHLGPALQALAHLAMLLDTGQLPTERLSTLIRTLCCPKTTDHYVWILDRCTNKPVRVKAYPYFHNVLLRLIHSLTKPEPMDRPPPRIDAGSYNALLFYAIRYRLSPALASDILNHMCCKRQPPLPPTTATYNTLIRAGTLVRRRDIVNRVLRALRGQSDRSVRSFEAESGLRDSDSLDVAHAANPSATSSRACQPERSRSPAAGSLTAPTSSPQSTSPCGSVDRSTSRIYMRECRLFQRLGEEDLNVPELFFKHGSVVNARTLVSYITYVTATGKPGVIGHVLFQMIPELALVDHPTWEYKDDSRQRPRLSSRLRKHYLQRVVHFGPYLFSAILNALAKAKMTGAAERVWLLAKQAEQASWLPNFVPDIEPWCLPVHAYTSMMRCYAAEAKKAVSSGRREQTSLKRVLQQEHEKPWVPMFRGKLPGWAAFVAAMQKLHLPKYKRRRRRLRSVASLLHRCMVSAGLMLYRTLLVMAKTQKPRRAWKGSLPVPDERFFNEALDLLGRQFEAAPRAQHTTPRFWRNRLRSAWHRYMQRHVKGEGWTSALQEVMQSVVEAGLPVPPGFRVSSIGHWDYAASTPEPVGPNRAHRRAFPVPRTPFRPHALVTVKTRGLPLPPKHRRTRSCCRQNASNK